MYIVCVVWIISTQIHHIRLCVVHVNVLENSLVKLVLANSHELPFSFDLGLNVEIFKRRVIIY
jgi:hypothetical protein